MRTIRILLTALSILSLTACAAMRPEPPEVQLAGLEMTDLSLSHANFLATLRLFNPNATALDIKGVKFTLQLNDIPVAKGKTAQAFNIPAEEFGEATLHLSSSYLNLLQLSTKLQGKEQLHFRITGEVAVGGPGFLTVNIPIDREGQLPLTGSLQQLAPGQQGQFKDSTSIPGQERFLRQ